MEAGGGIAGAELVPLARIIATLEGPGSERQLEGVLGVLVQQLSATVSLDPRVFLELFCGVEALLSRGDASASATVAVAEEVRVAAWDALRVLLRTQPDEQLKEPAMRLRLGHVVSLALDTATNADAGLELRTRGVTAVTELWRAVDDADCLACFFPGAASAMCKVVAGCVDARQNHALTCAALEAFADICEAILGDTACAAVGIASATEPNITAVVEDWRRQQSKVEPKPAATTAESSAATVGPGVGVAEDGSTYQYPRVVRDGVWLMDTSVRVCRLLAVALEKTARNENWHVRAAAVQMSERLLCTCARAVTASSRASGRANSRDGSKADAATGEPDDEDSLGILLCDTIVGSLYSDSPRLAAVARASLVSIRGLTCYTSGSGTGGLLRDARRRLHGLCSDVRRAMRQADDSRTRATLLLLCGYLEASMGDTTGSRGSQLPPLSPTLVRRVLGILLAAVALQPTPMGAVEKNLHSYRAIATASQQEHGAKLSEMMDRDKSRPVLAVESCMDAGGRTPLGMGRLLGASADARWSRRYLHFDDDGVESALRRCTKLLFQASPTGMIIDLLMAASRGEDTTADGMGEAACAENATSQSLLLKRQSAALVVLDYLVTPEPDEASAIGGGHASTTATDTTQAARQSVHTERGDGTLPGERQDMQSADKAVATEMTRMCAWVTQDTLAAVDNGCAVVSGAKSGEWLALAPLGVAVGSLGVGCIGKLAKAVGGDAFAPLLMHCLYPLLERVSDDSAEVSDAALRSLVAVAQTMRQFDAAENSGSHAEPTLQQQRSQPITPDEEVRWLLMANIDYIVDVICARLRYLHEHPSTPQVLQAVLAFTGTAVLPYIHDTLETLFECVEMSEERYLINFFTILRAVMDSLLLHVERSVSLSSAASYQDDDASASKRDGAPAVTVVDKEVALLETYINAHFAWLSPDEPDFSAAEAESSDPEPTSEPSGPESKPALTAVMATRILECCQHFVAGNGLRLKLIVFEVMASCIQFLGAQMVIERDNEGGRVDAAHGAHGAKTHSQTRHLTTSDFLPTIATLWEPFCRRLSEQSDSDAPALVAAMQVIEQLADCCGDFIARRFHDEAWPHIARYLSRYLANRAAIGVSTSADRLPNVSFSSSAAGRRGFTRQHKVIEAALGLIIRLASKQRDIFDVNKTQRVRAVASCCIGFLSSQEPLEYQAAAKQLFRNLIDIEADAVWLLLVGLAAPDTQSNAGRPARCSTASTNESRDQVSLALSFNCAQPAPPMAGAPSAGLLFRQFDDDGNHSLSREVCKVRKGAPSGRPRAEFQANCIELLRELV